jgi:hypothetical protein
MVQFKNVRVTVTRYDDKKPHPEYKLAQHATKRSQTVKEAYVGVVSVGCFPVVIEILPEFDFQSSHEVRIKRSVDGMMPISCYVSKNDMTNTEGAIASRIRRKAWEHDLKKIDDRCMSCGLVVADSQLGLSLCYRTDLLECDWRHTDEEAEPTVDQIAYQVNTCGKITMEV